MSEPDPVLHAIVLRDIGDWRLAGDNIEKALEAYREAWQLLGNLEDSGNTRTQLFNEPQVISGMSGLMPTDPWEDSQLSGWLANQMNSPLRDNFQAAVRTNPGGALSISPYDPRGQVELQFIVDEQGHAHNVHIVNAEQPWASTLAIRAVELHSLDRDSRTVTL